MRHLKIAVVILAAGGALSIAGAANAFEPTGLPAASKPLSSVEHVQYSFGGHRYCWYGAGWHGRGWYWCGYADAKHKGSGWGGEEGFRGWKHK